MLHALMTGLLPEISEHLRARFKRRSQDVLRVLGIPTKRDFVRFEERVLQVERVLDSLGRRKPLKQ
ncbi:MAG TPA: hypothetical protein VLJ37_10865 [bacterium]|nr:hypothetical protein [bacterium]